MSRTSASVSPAHAECEEDLKKAHDGVAVDAEADHAAGAVDLRDRVCRNESAAAGEEAGTDSDRIGNVGRRPVHRAFDRPDHAAARVGDEKAGRSEKLRSGHAHAGGTYTGPVTENRSRRKRFVNHHSPGFGGPAVTPSYNRQMDVSARHLRLLTETIAAVNSTLDLEEVLGLVARKVAEALEADACFVYLYDDQAGELVLRATHGTRVEEMTRTPRMKPGEGITGAAAAERQPIMLPAQAHLDPRFKAFPNLPEDQYESILAVPILARDKLAGALNVRTIEPREFSAGEMDLLVAIAAQVAQTIEHAKLYADAQVRVSELEALAKISEAVSESLYLEESLEAIVETTMEAVGATGAALVLEDGNIAWPEGRPGKHVIRLPLRWKRRAIGELVCDRDTPFTEQERALLISIAHHAAVALEHGRAVMRGVLAQEIHHRVKNNLQTVASLLRLQARSDEVDPRKALEDSVNRVLAIAAVHAGGRPGDGARARLQRAPAERTRARRELSARRAGPARRPDRARHRRRRRRDHRRGARHRAVDRARPRPGRAAGDARLPLQRRPARRGRLSGMRGPEPRARDSEGPGPRARDSRKVLRTFRDQEHACLGMADRRARLGQRSTSTGTTRSQHRRAFVAPS